MARKRIENAGEGTEKQMAGITLLVCRDYRRSFLFSLYCSKNIARYLANRSLCIPKQQRNWKHFKHFNHAARNLSALQLS